MAQDAASSATVPLTIDEAVRLALRKNYTIEVARYAEPIASANVLAAKGIFDPTVSVDYTGSHHETAAWNDLRTGAPPPGLVEKSDSVGARLGGLLPWGMSYALTGASENYRKNTGGFTDNYGTSLGLTLRQPLLRGFGAGGALATVRIAQTDRAISTWDFRGVVIDTVTRVVFACNEVHFAQARLRSTRRSREVAEQLYRENQKRFERSAMSEFEVLSAQSGVANREGDILDAERMVRDSENFLRALISDDHTPALLNAALVLAPPALPVVAKVDAAADFPGALGARPDYQNALLAVKRGDIVLRQTRNQALPGLDLVGSYATSGAGADFSASRRQVLDRDYPSYSAGVVLSVPLTFAGERGRIRGARLAVQQSEAYLRAVEQMIVVAVGNAARNVETTWKRVQATATARELSAQTLEGELKRLRAGTGATYFVLQQQERVSFDEVKEARAHADYRNALAEYHRQLGRTLERFNITFTPDSP